MVYKDQDSYISKSSSVTSDFGFDYMTAVAVG